MLITKLLRHSGAFIGGVLLIGSLCGATLADAAIYYVKKTGNDGNSCPQAQNPSTPKLTILNARACLAAGDTLRIGPGTWVENFSTDQSRLPNGPSASQPTTFEGDASSWPVIRPTTTAGNGYLIHLNSSRNNLRWRNFVLDTRGLNESSAVAFSTGNGTFNNITIENCDAIGRGSSMNSASAFYITRTASGVVVRNCKIHGFHAQVHAELGAHGLYWNGANGIIENNEIYDNNGYALQLYNSSCYDCVNNNIVRNNYMHDNRNGVYMARGFDNYVYNNIMARSGGNGFWFTNGRNYLFNNTVYDSAGRGLSLTGGSGEIRNNIFYQNGQNIVHEAGTPTLSNNLTANPQFVNPAGSNFRLQTGSPAINAGTTVSAVRTDITGMPRPQGANYDVGAFEYAGGTPVAPPTNVRIIGVN